MSAKGAFAEKTGSIMKNATLDPQSAQVYADNILRVCGSKGSVAECPQPIVEFSNATLSSRIVARSLVHLSLLLISVCFAAAQSNAIVVESDITPPASIIQSRQPGTTLQTGSQVIITGTASDLGGQVWGVEVSTDGGTTWQPAVRRGNWSYAWTPTASGSMTIKSRAVDDSGNLETAAPGITVTVVGGLTTIWPSNAVPGIVDHSPG
jgi:Bacterial Ig domain